MIAPSERPSERLGGKLVSLLKAEQTILDGGAAGEVVWCEDLALDNAEVDLDLVEPTGEDWGVDKNDVGPFGPKPIEGGLLRCGEPLSTNRRCGERYDRAAGA